MGRKGKPEDREDFEIWLNTTGGWKRVEEEQNGGVFTAKNRALLLAESKSNGDDVIEVMVISRRPIAVFNGPAISAKHMMAAMEKERKKKEESNVAVPSGGPQKDDVPKGDAQLGGEAAAGERAGDRAPQG
jgi:hypothetical protein